jgi:metal-responsive CopG/Arc/MetJ family transcriptional regulator
MDEKKTIISVSVSYDIPALLEEYYRKYNFHSKSDLVETAIRNFLQTQDALHQTKKQQTKTKGEQK